MQEDKRRVPEHAGEDGPGGRRSEHRCREVMACPWRHARPDGSVLARRVVLMSVKYERGAALRATEAGAGTRQHLTKQRCARPGRQPVSAALSLVLLAVPSLATAQAENINGSIIGGIALVVVLIAGVPVAITLILGECLAHTRFTEMPPGRATLGAGRCSTRLPMMRGWCSCSSTKEQMSMPWMAMGWRWGGRSAPGNHGRRPRRRTGIARGRCRHPRAGPPGLDAVALACDQRPGGCYRSLGGEGRRCQRCDRPGATTWVHGQPITSPCGGPPTPENLTHPIVVVARQWTPLHHGAFSGHGDVVECLIAPLMYSFAGPLAAHGSVTVTMPQLRSARTPAADAMRSPDVAVMV